MGNLIDEHKKMQKLVEARVLIPGMYSGKVGSMTYIPISIEEYLNRVKVGGIVGLAYNTRTMGRGIFTLGNEGEIINFKGVDSQLQNDNSIAVSKTEGELEKITEQPSYGINAAHFIDRSKANPEGKERMEFRVKGASQFQNILAEKIKRDLIEKRDKKQLIKLPKLDMPIPFSEEFCERFDLPRVVELTDEFINGLESGSYGRYCYDYLNRNGTTINTRNQLWTEYFKEKDPSRLQDDNFRALLDREDSTYGLGAIFGQTTRTLDNPFRIMELDYYIKTNDTDAVRAIMEYSIGRCNGDLLSQYSVLSARNAAGFMNLNLAFSNFEHRQDFPLSGEICDDAYDDISSSLRTTSPTRADEYNKLKYRNQIYLWITNMKIIENAYTLLGMKIPQGYKESFIQTFYEALEDKENFKKCFKSPEPMDEIRIINNAEKNFEGMESIMQDFRNIAVNLYKAKMEENEKSNEESNDQWEL